jgi:hypothetical protein
MSKPPVSRRSLLATAGLGSVALGASVGLASATLGATAAGAAAPTEPAPHTPPIDTRPIGTRPVGTGRSDTLTASSPLPTTTTPGFDYAFLGPTNFTARGAVDYHEPTMVGAYSLLSPAIEGTISLPVGARLREISLVAKVAAGTMILNAYSINSSDAVLVGTASVSAGALFPARITLDTVVDADSIVFVSIYGATTSTNVVQRVRFGYEPPYRRFVALSSPVRVLDTRHGMGHAIFAADEERPVDLSAVLPAGATAAACNLTCTQPVGSGYLAAFAANTPWSGTSNVNFGLGLDVANSSLVAVSPERAITVRAGGAATHVLLDVTGYFI